MGISIRGIDTAYVAAIRAGERDANGQVALRRVSVGSANPCRHCLGLIAEGEQKLVLSYRPFRELQPYAETGPIFLHANECARYESDRLPLWFAYLQPAIIRGYGHDDWILYETASVTSGEKLGESCRAILRNADVAYVHIRSKFNCFQARVDRS